jgi:hypothetical protein
VKNNCVASLLLNEKGDFNDYPAAIGVLVK